MDEELFDLECVETGDLTPMELLVGLKKAIHPRGFLLPDELKKVVCDWIDLNVTHSL